MRINRLGTAGNTSHGAIRTLRLYGTRALHMIYQCGGGGYGHFFFFQIFTDFPTFYSEYTRSIRTTRDISLGRGIRPPPPPCSLPRINYNTPPQLVPRIGSLAPSARAQPNRRCTRNYDRFRLRLCCTATVPKHIVIAINTRTRAYFNI